MEDVLVDFEPFEVGFYFARGATVAKAYWLIEYLFVNVHWSVLDR